MADAPKAIWKDLIGPALQVIMVAGGLAIFLSNSASKGDSTAAGLADMRAEMRQSLDRINLKLEGFPGYQERVAQIEKRLLDQQAFNGGLDGRLSTVEKASAVYANQIENIRSASSIPLRK